MRDLLVIIKIFVEAIFFAMFLATIAVIFTGDGEAIWFMSMYTLMFFAIHRVLGNLIKLIDKYSE